MVNRVIIAFHSRKGHTRSLAQEIFRLLETEGVSVSCHELEPAEELGLMRTGTRVLTRRGEPIKELDMDLGGVNLLLIGTPVWGGGPTPYVRTFIEQSADLHGMPVVLFATCRGSDGSAAEVLRELVRGQGGRPFEYHVWRIKKDGREGMERAASRVVTSALQMLPPPEEERPIEVVALPTPEANDREEGAREPINDLEGARVHRGL